MTPLAPDETRAERFLALFARVLFWTAFAALAAGLLLWMRDHAAAAAPLLLVGGLLGLLLLPILRLSAVLATAARERDRLTLAATLAVFAILLALTLRDALRM